MRPSQIGRLTREDFHLHEPIPHVSAPPGRRSRLTAVPLVDEALTAARAFLDSDAFGAPQTPGSTRNGRQYRTGRPLAVTSRPIAPHGSTCPTPNAVHCAAFPGPYTFRPARPISRRRTAPALPWRRGSEPRVLRTLLSGSLQPPRAPPALPTAPSRPPCVSTPSPLCGMCYSSARSLPTTRSPPRPTVSGGPPRESSLGQVSLPPCRRSQSTRRSSPKRPTQSTLMVSTSTRLAPRPPTPLPKGAATAIGAPLRAHFPHEPLSTILHDPVGPFPTPACPLPVPPLPHPSPPTRSPSNLRRRPPPGRRIRPLLIAIRGHRPSRLGATHG